MVEIGLLFRKERFLFNVSAGTAPSASFQNEITARLSSVGGKALAWSSGKAHLQLYPGHVMSISYVRNSYINVDISVPTCHDTYDGALGQTFQCKYVEDPEAFVSSTEKEESFRIPITPTGAFQVNSTCADSLGKRKRMTMVSKENRAISWW
jgi:hypothetical protein